MKSSTIPNFINKFTNNILILIEGVFSIVILYVMFRFVSMYFGWTPVLHNMYVYWMYIIVALVGIVLCFIVSRCTLNYKVNIVLVGISIMFGLYLSEFVLACLAFYQENQRYKPVFQIQKRTEVAQTMGIPYDSRRPLEVIADLRKQGVDAYPIIPAASFLRGNSLLFPLNAGISHKTTVLCNESGEYAIYESDEHGFNNPSGIFAQESIDIALLGDSFTHGACVRPGENISDQLRKTGKRVLNLGVSGNGPLLELAILQEYVKPIKPKIVLWMYFERDLGDLAIEKTDFFLRRYLDNGYSQNLMERQAEVDLFLSQSFNPQQLSQNLDSQEKVEEIQKQKYREQLRARLYNTSIKFIKLWHWRSKLGVSANGVLSSLVLLSEENIDFLLLTQILQEAKERIAEWGGQLYFVYLPFGIRYVKEFHEDRFDSRNRVLSIVKNLDIPVIDTHAEVFTRHHDPLSLFPLRLVTIPGGNHYTAEGYRLIAQAIAGDLGLTIK